jgi:2-isopropylmalate synthase
MVQGTINGIGERCGNANLVTIMPTLRFDMGYDIGITDKALANLVVYANSFATLLDMDVPPNAPYVGRNAFAHKGGIHGSAVEKNPDHYQHIRPELVGNRSQIVVSDQAGMSNLRQQLKGLGIKVADNDPALKTLLEEVKQRSHEGYAYDNALGSFALLSLRVLGRQPKFFSVRKCTIQNFGLGNKDQNLDMISCASIKLQVGKQRLDAKAERVGPVDALDTALRKALGGPFPVIENFRLTDYHVRILDTKAATAAKTRVLLESQNTKDLSSWVTIGVSENIINASLQAMYDSYVYGIMQANNREPTPTPVRHQVRWRGATHAAQAGHS